MRNTKFNWLCVHCGKRNIEVIKFQFDIPKKYTAQWACAKCGKETEITIALGINLPTKAE